jgi:hypothetical protein
MAEPFSNCQRNLSCSTNPSLEPRSTTMRAMIENARSFYTVEPAVSQQKKKKERKKRKNEEKCGTSPGVNRGGVNATGENEIEEQIFNPRSAQAANSTLFRICGGSNAVGIRKPAPTIAWSQTLLPRPARARTNRAQTRPFLACPGRGPTLPYRFTSIWLSTCCTLGTACANC